MIPYLPVERHDAGENKASCEWAIHIPQCLPERKVGQLILCPSAALVASRCFRGTGTEMII